MKCEIINDLLPLYIENICCDETKKAVEEHLASCPSCLRTYQSMKEEIIEDDVINLKEKELWEKGEHTITAILKEKSLNRGILVDTLLNILLIIYCIIWSKTNITPEQFGAVGAVMVSVITFSILGMFTVYDMIYWILHFKKKISVIAYEVAKTSIYIKVVFLITILISATVIGILEIYFP